MPKVSFTIGTGVSSVHWKLYSSANVLQLEGDVSNGNTFSRIHRAGMYVVISSITPYSNYTTPYYYTRTDGYVQNLSNDNVISFSDSVTTKEGTITATQKAAPSTYTLTYNLDGGSGDSSTQTKTHGINITLHGAPTKTGYDFQYWQDQTNYSTWAAGANFTENRSTTFKAIWSRKTYTVTYDANGGSRAPSAQTKTHDVDLTLSSTKPIRTGYDFLYWMDDYIHAQWSPGETYTLNRSVTLKAQWQLKTYTVSYDANGGADAPSAQTKYYGENLILTTDEPTRTGYNFINWFDGTDYYSPGGVYTANSSTTLYAQWNRKKYTISYNANGGSGAPSPQIKEYGIMLTLSSVEPTWSGHIFLYWQDQGTDYHIWYPGNNFDRDRNTTLTAIWKTACDLFYWHGSASADSSKFASGKPVSDALTAAAWNSAIDKTNEIRELLEQSATTIPKVTAGSQITAVAFNQLRLAIGSTIGAGTLPAAVSKGDTISISLFIGSGSLREALNTAIDTYNNSK